MVNAVITNLNRFFYPLIILLLVSSLVFKLFLPVFFASLFFSVLLKKKYSALLFLVLSLVSLVSSPLVLSVLVLHSAFLTSAYLLLGDKLFRLKKGELSLRSGFFTVLILLAFFILSILVFLLISLLSIGDYTQVAKVLDSLPFYLLLFGIFIAPITEELFFRKAIIERFGLIPSLLLFPLAHISYSSISEILGVFALGFVLSFFYYKKRWVVPCILAHMIYNAVAIFSMLYSN